MIHTFHKINHRITNQFFHTRRRQFLIPSHKLNANKKTIINLTTVPIIIFHLTFFYIIIHSLISQRIRHQYLCLTINKIFSCFLMLSNNTLFGTLLPLSDACLRCNHQKMHPTVFIRCHKLSKLIMDLILLIRRKKRIIVRDHFIISKALLIIIQNQIIFDVLNRYLEHTYNTSQSLFHLQTYFSHILLFSLHTSA